MSKVNQESKNRYNYYRLTPSEYDEYQQANDVEKIMYIEVIYSDGKPPYKSYVVVFKEARNVLNDEEIIERIVSHNTGNIAQCFVDGEPYKITNL